MPSSRQARMILRAISPRFAIRMRENMERLLLLDEEERLAELHGLAVLDQDLLDHPAYLRLDLVHDLHGFDDADHLLGADLVAGVDERVGVGLGRAVERPDQR